MKQMGSWENINRIDGCEFLAGKYETKNKQAEIYCKEPGPRTKALYR